MRVPRIAAGTAVALLLCVPPDVQAEPVRIDFAIDVRAVFGNLQDVFGSVIAVGDVVRGTLVYDASTPDTAPSPVEGFYLSPGTLSFATGTPLTLPLDGIWIFEQSANPPPHSDDVFAAFAITHTFPGFDAVQAELFLGGAGQDGVALPATPAALLAAFGQGGIRFAAWQTGGNPPFDSGTHELSGTVRVLAVDSQPVPEPGTLLLLATGAAAILRRHRSVSGGLRCVRSSSSG